MTKVKIQIIHNPRCGKSRSALSELNKHDLNLEIREYLKDPLSKAEIKLLLQKLNLSAVDIIRKTEKDFKENFKGKSLSEDEWINAMIEFPKLIQRPIIIKKDKAVVGRTNEAIESILND